MEKIRLQREHLGTSQEFDRMSEGVSTFLGIPRSANKSKDKTKSERRSQLLGSKGLDRYRPFRSADSGFVIYMSCSSASEGLAASSISTLFNSSISERS